MEAVAGTKRRADAAGLDVEERESKLARYGEPALSAGQVSGAPSAEPEDENDADAAQKLEIQEQLSMVEEERTLLLAAENVNTNYPTSTSDDAGKHAGYTERCTIFDNRQLTELARAVTIRELQMKNIEMLYEYAKFAAEKVCDDSKRKLRELMLQELEERQKQLNDKLAGVVEQRLTGAARKLRSKAKGDEPQQVAAAPLTASAKLAQLLSGVDASGAPIIDSGVATGVLPASGAPAGQAGPTIMLGLDGAPPPPLAIPLPNTDIMSDLKTIYKDWRATAQRWRSTAASALLPARVERNKLYYCNDCYSRGDHVTVFSELTRQEYYGTMHFLAPAEVIVRLSDGTKARVPLQHLRHGRVSLYKASNPGATTAQTQGGAADSGAHSAAVPLGVGGSVPAANRRPQARAPAPTQTVPKTSMRAPAATAPQAKASPVQPGAPRSSRSASSGPRPTVAAMPAPSNIAVSIVPADGSVQPPQSIGVNETSPDDVLPSPSAETFGQDAAPEPEAPVPESDSGAAVEPVQPPQEPEETAGHETSL